MMHAETDNDDDVGEESLDSSYDSNDSEESLVDGEDDDVGNISSKKVFKSSWMSR